MALPSSTAATIVEKLSSANTISEKEGKTMSKSGDQILTSSHYQHYNQSVSNIIRHTTLVTG
jgi:hypothetical protein